MSVQRLMQSIVRDLLPYAGLDFRLPSGLHLYVPDRGAWSSLGEVFIARVYDPFYEHLGDVRHWVDLGCNQGFFSFGLLEHLAQKEARLSDTRVFLGDANANCVARVRSAIEHNHLQNRWQCEAVIIGPPDTTVTFQQHKDSLHSNIFARGRGEKKFQLPTTNISQRMAEEEGLFDLVKVDIEGAEKFLFDHHLDFLKRFRYGLCEWHAPMYSGTELVDRLRQLNWKVINFRSSGVEYDLRQGDSWTSTMGTVLWENPNPAR